MGVNHYSKYIDRFFITHQSGYYLKPICVIVNANGKLQDGFRCIVEYQRKPSLVNNMIRCFGRGVVKSHCFRSSIIC
jgi:hypothetical protein